jgi:shikimate kinase
MNKKIFLIGSMGSGKSTIGRLLAKKLNLPHYDLDTMIEKQQKKQFQKFSKHIMRNILEILSRRL